jgi:ubiquinone/menaquinone biosynthesis C-methylase UbiE
VDRACGTAELRRWREQVAAGLFGTVVEVGFGSGLNMPAYTADVTLVYAVEPAATARRLAEQRIADSAITVEHIALRGESIPLDDASCDGALSTFTLCTIPDVERALAEIWRVLRPGGRFQFLEHGLSPDAAIARRGIGVVPGRCIVIVIGARRQGQQDIGLCRQTTASATLIGSRSARHLSMACHREYQCVRAG